MKLHIFYTYIMTNVSKTVLYPAMEICSPGDCVLFMSGSETCINDISIF